MPNEPDSKDDMQKPTVNSRESGLSHAAVGDDASDAKTVPAPPDDEPGPTLSDSAQRMIGVQLRKLYRSTVDEPVPNEFLRLLDKLDGLEQGT